MSSSVTGFEAPKGFRKMKRKKIGKKGWNVVEKAFVDQFDGDEEKAKKHTKALKRKGLVHRDQIAGIHVYHAGEPRDTKTSKQVITNWPFSRTVVTDDGEENQFLPIDQEIYTLYQKKMANPINMMLMSLPLIPFAIKTPKMVNLLYTSSFDCRMNVLDYLRMLLLVRAIVDVFKDLLPVADREDVDTGYDEYAMEKGRLFKLFVASTSNIAIEEDEVVTDDEGLAVFNEEEVIKSETVYMDDLTQYGECLLSYTMDYIRGNEMYILRHFPQISEDYWEDLCWEHKLVDTDSCNTMLLKDIDADQMILDHFRMRVLGIDPEDRHLEDVPALSFSYKSLDLSRQCEVYQMTEGVDQYDLLFRENGWYDDIKGLAVEDSTPMEDTTVEQLEDGVAPMDEELSFIEEDDL